MQPRDPDTEVDPRNRCWLHERVPEPPDVTEVRHAGDRYIIRAAPAGMPHGAAEVSETLQALVRLVAL
jgi:hypothetical protein